MKKITLSLIAGLVCTMAFAQKEYRKAPTFGVHFALNDFQTAADIRAMGLSNVLKANQWSKTSRMRGGLGFTYIQGMTDHIDFAATLTGSYLSYPVPNKSIDGKEDLLLEAAATANLKLLTDKYFFNPFLTLGIGASKYRGYFAAVMPIGAGIQIKTFPNTYLLIHVVIESVFNFKESGSFELELSFLTI